MGTSRHISSNRITSGQTRHLFGVPADTKEFASLQENRNAITFFAMAHQEWHAIRQMNLLKAFLLNFGWRALGKIPPFPNLATQERKVSSGETGPDSMVDSLPG